MAAYRYLAADIVTGTLLEELPLNNVRYEQVLNRAGGFQASINLRHPKATRNNLNPGSTVIYVERDGVIMGSGFILWRAVPKSDAGTIDLSGEGLWSYFARRHVRTLKTYAATDQFAIAQDLLNYAQSQTGGDIHIVVGTETSGVLRDQTYKAEERKPIAQAIEQLSAVINGFDFVIESKWVGSSIVSTFVPSYPKRGRTTTLVFELGSNVSSLSEEIDAGSMAWLVDAFGDKPTNESALVATATDSSQYPAYPLLEKVTQYSGITILDTLQGHADADLALYKNPLELPSFTIQPSPDSAPGAWITGDTVTVRAQDGMIDVDGQFRIVSFNIAVNDAGGEAVSMTIVSADAL